MRAKFLLILTLLWWGMATAQPLSEQSRISLLTCGPGEELYTRYGHTAIRVADPANQLDVVFNYGIFDFHTDHFYWKFMRGETYYQLGIESMRDFYWNYTYSQRSIYEQVLNLSLEQRQTLFDALVANYQPENRQYLYNFVFDNCATRPYYLIKHALGDTIISTFTGAEGQTYRRFLRHYTRPASWANFGINLLFGPKADVPMTSEQRLFLPEELMYYIAEAKLPDGKPIVSDKQAIPPFEIAPVPWYATWYFGVALWVAIMIGISCIDRRRGKLSWWADATMGVVYACVLLIVFFLTFFSVHPLVGFGWRLLIIPLIHLCTRLVYIIR
ncbi:MAG: DUF4105 domain-containing protein [Paludibacteraceae bacterium]